MAVGASPQWHPLTPGLATLTILNMTHLPARNAASSLRQRAFALLLISLMTAGLLSAPTPAVAATQTISGAVVALPLSYNASAPWEGGGCETDAYRLKCMKALYLPGFGANNVVASVFTEGGCATKSSGTTSCYGLPGFAGDGTNRARPLPVSATHRYVQLARVVYRSFQSVALRVNWSNDYLSEDELRGTTSTCGLTSPIDSGEVLCWGGNIGASPIGMGTGFVSLTSSGAVHQDGSLYLFLRSPSSHEQLLKVSMGVVGHVASASDQVVWLPIKLLHQYFANPPFSSTGDNLSIADTGGGYSVSYEGNFGGVCLVTEAGPAKCGLIVPNTPWEAIGDLTFSDELRSLGLLGLKDPSGAELGSDKYLSVDDALVPAGITALMSSGESYVCGKIDENFRCAYGNDPGANDWYWSSYLTGDEWAPNIGGIYAQIYAQWNLPFWSITPSSAAQFPESYEKLVGDTQWWCAQASTMVECAPTQYDSRETSQSGAMEYLDANHDGKLTVGTEVPLECGVGFQCAFDPDTMSLETGVLTMTGTLTRTPRASITLSGILRLSDGQPAAGQMEWRSNDGLLRSSIEIAPDGRFVLPARTGAGSVSYLKYGNATGCPAMGTPGAWSSGCTTGYSTVAFTKDFTGSLGGMDLTLPTFPGEQRTLRLQFGDEATGIRGASLWAVGEPTPTCEVSTTMLGVLRACFFFSFEGSGAVPVTNSAGEITLYSPTESDIEYEISTTASDGIQWSDRRVSFRDDGATPDAWVFPGLIFASTPSSMTMARGGSMQVASSVSVDGLDPAFGLAARLVPLSGQVKACSSEAVTSESDAEGDLAFRVCPGATGSWRIVSADGSFFPSAPFTISVPLMVSSITLKGAKISSPFNPAVARRYSGAFTSSTATFAVTLTKAAKKAVVSAARCTRPTSGARTCKVTVKLNGTVETYTFVLNRK